MEYSSLFIVNIVVFILTVVIVWFFLKEKYKQTSIVKNSKLISEKAILNERLNNKNDRLIQLESLLESKEKLISLLQTENTDIKTKISGFETKIIEDKKNYEEKIKLINEIKHNLTDNFKIISTDALNRNNKTFIELASESLGKFQENAKNDLNNRQKSIENFVIPIRESLDKVDKKINEIEKNRLTSYVSLTEQIKSLAYTEGKLQAETANLVKALRSPNVRGRWGEMQLKRVVEIAGMVEYCDYFQQQTANEGETRLRPDMIIKLPNNKNIVIDSKTPLQAYLEALDATDEAIKQNKLKDHARQIRNHISKLTSKAYWEQFEPTPEFVVIFLPGETFFSAALEQDPSLIEFGVDNKVILATPTTLIALLRAVSYGWKQETISKNTKIVSDLGKELYDRVRSFCGHFSEIRKGLDRSVEAYNKAVGSMESRILTTTRKFKELGASSGDDITTIKKIDKTTRMIQMDNVKE